MNPFKIVKDFEEAVAVYTGAPYAVAVNSCTNALFLALRYAFDQMWERKISFKGDYNIEIPKRTYISVPMQIMHAGFDVKFRDEDWKGKYQLRPFPIWDAARRFTSGMWYDEEYADLDKNYICVSFHWSKILGIQQGGAILTNDTNFVDWAKRARFDGRTEGIHPSKDKFLKVGWHMYMSPEIAAEGLVRLHHLPKRNPDLPNDDYPDLSTLELFK